jgi:uncharacterized phage protein (TIGR01671 family)
MSRQIKFRGLTDTQAPTWVYGSLVNNLWTYSENSKYPKGSPVCEILVPGETDCWEDIDTYEQVATVLPNSVGQFTGLQDKAGRDIYEGDVVKDRFGRIMQVQWWNFRLCWVAISETNFHHADLYDWVDFDYEKEEKSSIARVEVIGNVYENPELLTNLPAKNG